MAASPDELKAILDQKFPISLKEIESIVIRVHDRYPYLSRYEVTIIVKKFFEIMRYLLITGGIISINSLSANIKLLTIKKLVLGKNILVNKIKLSTPKKMKNEKL